MRNPSADLDMDNISGDIDEWATRSNMVRARRPKRKSKRPKKSGHRSPTRHRRHRKSKRVKRSSHSKKSRKGKRPYPHWLKKYWFKKKK